MSGGARERKGSGEQAFSLHLPDLTDLSKLTYKVPYLKRCLPLLLTQMPSNCVHT